MSDPATERPSGDPLVPRPEEDRPAEGDRPHVAPEDTEPPQGDPVTHPGATPEEQSAAAAADSSEDDAADHIADAAVAGDDDLVAGAEARAAEYLELAKRKQAEFENFRRRMNLQVAQAEDRGVAKLAKELLPALDHLELALEAAEKHEGAGEWLKGIRLVQEEVLGALGRVGIQSFAPFGEPFDPNEHEAMAQQPAAEGQEPGTVSQVYQAGYRINGAVLRPARVIVAA